MGIVCAGRISYKGNGITSADANIRVRQQQFAILASATEDIFNMGLNLNFEGRLVTILYHKRT